MTDVEIVGSVAVLIAMTAGISAAWYALAQAHRRSPDTLHKMQRLFDGQNERLNQQAGRIDAMELEIDDLRTALSDNHDEMRQLRDGIGQLVTQIRAAGMTPVWTPEQVVKPKRFSRAGLARAIDGHFSINEIDDLAFEFGLAHDEISGDTRAARSRSLVTWAADHGRLPELRSRVAALRPGATMPPQF